jgi:WD40 repeat protein
MINILIFFHGLITPDRRYNQHNIYRNLSREMLRRVLPILLTGVGVTGMAYSSFLPSKTVAQEMQTNLLAQSSGEITVRDLQGFNGVTNALAVSSDGTTLFVAAGDGTITAIDTISLEQKYVIPFNINPYSNIAVSPNGEFFAAGGQRNNEIVIFNANNGGPAKTLQGSQGKLSAIAFSPDSRILVTTSADERTIRLWDVEGGNLIQTIGQDAGPEMTVAFSPNGEYFVTGSILNYRYIKFWETKSGNLLLSTPQQPGFVNKVAISPDGKTLVAAVRNFVKVWSLIDNGGQFNPRELFTIKGPPQDINTIAFSPDGRLVASANKEGTVMLFDVVQGRVLTSLVGHRGWVLSVAFGPNGQYLYSAGEDKMVKIWDLSRWR